MTGYGRCRDLIAGKDITVEIRSVNYKSFETGVKAPRVYGFLEDKLRKHIHTLVSRGKLEVNVFVISVDDGSVTVEVNKTLAKGYIDAVKDIADSFGLENDLTASSLMRYSDIFTVRREPEDEEAIWEAVKSVADRAAADFIAMREREGENLRQDIESRLDTIIAAVERIEANSPETLARYRERLRSKMEELLGDRQIDEQRLLTECAIFADKIAVDEETVRLRSHVAQFRHYLGSGEAVGKKLDFLVQELNREINTIGSKAQNSDTAHIVVEVKAEIEKIREQIQNIE